MQRLFCQHLGELVMKIPSMLSIYFHPQGLWLN